MGFLRSSVLSAFTGMGPAPFPAAHGRGEPFGARDGNMSTTKQQQASAQKAAGSAGRFGHLERKRSAVGLEDSANKESFVPTLQRTCAQRGMTGTVAWTQEVDPNFGTPEHYTYTGASGRVIAFGRDSRGMFIASRYDRQDTDGYFTLEGGQGEHPLDQLQTAVDDAAVEDHLRGGVWGEGSIEVRDIDVTANRPVQVHIMVTDEDDGEFYSVSVDLESGDAKVFPAHGTGTVKGDEQARILSELSLPAHDDNAEQRDRHLAETLRESLDRLREDPDISEHLRSSLNA